MPHDPDLNITMTPRPDVTDVFEFLMGEGFVMVSDQYVQKMHELPPREVWPGIEDDVRALEGLLT